MSDSRDRVMWKHWCSEEQAWISVGKGERCNWCNQLEPKG